MMKMDQLNCKLTLLHITLLIGLIVNRPILELENMKYMLNKDPGEGNIIKQFS
jgi:hypothetical protein